MGLRLGLVPKNWGMARWQQVLREGAGIAHLYDIARTVAIEEEEKKKGFPPQLRQISLEL